MICIFQDELNAELEELEQEDLDEEMLKIGDPPMQDLPTVPDTELPQPSEFFLMFVHTIRFSKVYSLIKIPVLSCINKE